MLHEHCLVHAMACLVKDFNVQDFGELLPVVGGVSAMDMNRGFRSISSEMDMEVLVLVSSPSMDDLGCESSTWMCLEVDDAGNHHWWGLYLPETGGAVIADSLTGGALLWIPMDNLMETLSAVDTVCYFKLSLRPRDEVMPDGMEYHLRGKGGSSCPNMRKPATTHSGPQHLTSSLGTSLECGGSLRKERTINARLYELSGVRSVEHVTKKCSNGNCATLHHYNYRWVDGKKINNCMLHDLDTVFVNPKTAFDRLFLDYHGALQFRLCPERDSVEGQ